MLPPELPKSGTILSSKLPSTGDDSEGSTKTDKECCLGFEDSSSKLRELWYRWKALEHWIDLAIRPKNLHPDDRCVLVNDEANEQDGDSSVDDLDLLKKQCSKVQNLFNSHLSTLKVETTRWASSLMVRPSQIAGAGMGLYYQPEAIGSIEQKELSSNSVVDDDKGRSMGVLPSGSTVCYYTGHVHTHSSAAGLSDKSYLMWIRGNILVDPSSLKHIQARYINDPLNDALVNCAYVPTTILHNVETNGIPHEDTIRTSVVTIRDIQPGEELFVRYGDVYWDKQPIVGRRLIFDRSSKNTDINNNDDDDEQEESSDGESTSESDDLDEMFPFSPLFQSKLVKPTLWESDTCNSQN